MLSYRSALVLMAMLLTPTYCLDVGEVRWGFCRQGRCTGPRQSALGGGDQSSGGAVRRRAEAAMPAAISPTMARDGRHRATSRPTPRGACSSTPWIDEVGESFELSWKPGDGHSELDALETSAPATVVFVDDAILTGRRGAAALRR